MTGYISYNGIPCECGACGAKVSENDAHMTVLWSNGHGTGIRIFCDECGIWTDWKYTFKRGLSSRIFRPVIPHPTYVDKHFEATS
jgi:hypothetical protein